MRILIVEDEHKIANSIKRGLEQETYAVDVAYDGTDGFDLAASEDYDVIVLDLLLPKLDGLQIAKKLREQNIHTPILMLTAKDSVEDRVEGLNAGADDYLAKPFAFEELLARIRALTRRPKDRIKTTLIVSDLSLDINTYQVKRLGREIRLSTREYTLLEYLIRHPNQTLTKDQIIAHVWNYEANILPNTLEVYIGYLRKKLGKPNLIQTVRGFGYRIGKS